MKSVLTLPAHHCHIATIHLAILTEDTVIQSVGKQLMEAAEESGYRLVIDFSQIERFSSAFLGKLLQLRRIIKANAGKLALCGCGDAVMGAMKVTGFVRLFEFCEGEAEALEFMRPRGLGVEA